MNPRILLLLLVSIGVPASGQMIGVNVLLNTPPTSGVLAQLNGYGNVLDVMPEINAVTIRAHESDLPLIRALGCVAAADADAWCVGASMPASTTADFATGANLWHLDAINVTDHETTRVVDYDGDGVYVAVIDSGLQHNWRSFFPEARIATQFAMAFGGGNGEAGTVSSQPDKWEHDVDGHGTQVTSVILGFSYHGTQAFNGVAPRATVIPIKAVSQSDSFAYSTLTRAILYAASLKTSGALGSSRLVINMSTGAFTPDATNRAAIDYAIANGVIVVVCAGNEAAGGMRYPGAYPEVISVGAIGWVRSWPADEPTKLWWILRDVPENDVTEFFVPGFSAHALPGQELDVSAPGLGVTTPLQGPGQVDYTFFYGTSASCPHVAGLAALMLQKNPTLTQTQIESILVSTAMPVAGGCTQVMGFEILPGLAPTFSHPENALFFPVQTCWDPAATGHGLVRADAALDATPMP